MLEERAQPVSLRYKEDTYYGAEKQVSNDGKRWFWLSVYDLPRQGDIVTLRRRIETAITNAPANAKGLLVMADRVDYSTLSLSDK